MNQRSNLHSHTQFCDGRASMSEMVDAARRAGFTQWGFSPHAPIAIPSPCNMAEADVPLYLAEVERLRKAWPQMTISAGMEVDYLDDARGPASDAVKGYGLDYVIGSVHFVPDRQGVFHDIDGSPERFRQRLAENFDGDLAYVVRTFWAQTCAMIRAGGLDIVGHIDKIAGNASSVCPLVEQDDDYRRLADRAVALAIEARLPVEINTKQRHSAGRFFPHPRYWARIARAGIDMPVNTDAHRPEAVDAALDEAAELLEAIVEMDTAGLSCVKRGATFVARRIDAAHVNILDLHSVRQIYAEVITPDALALLSARDGLMVDYDRLESVTLPHSSKN